MAIPNSLYAMIDEATDELLGRGAADERSVLDIVLKRFPSLPDADALRLIRFALQEAVGGRLLNRAIDGFERGEQHA